MLVETQEPIEVSILDGKKQLKDAEDLAELTEKLKASPNVEILTLQGNSLAPGAGKELAKQIRILNLKNIKVLNFSDLFTGRVRAEIPPTLTYIFDALMEVGCKLEIINLSDNAFGPDGAKPCIPLLKSPACNTSLKELYFNNNGLGRGGVVIARALEDANKECNFTYPLEVFVAGRNRLENPGAKALANALLKMPKIKKFSVPQNGIRPAGVIALSNAICNLKTLKILDISDNCMTSKAAIPMAKALANLEQLEDVNFSDTLIRNRGLKAFGDVLQLHDFPKLKKVNVAYGQIKKKYAVDFAEKISAKPYLELNINGNEIGDEGIIRITSFNNLVIDEEEGFDDDEGSPENSSDDEDYDEVTDTESLCEADYEITSTNKNFIEEKSEKCTSKEFLNNPTGSKLLGISETYGIEKATENLLNSYVSQVKSYRNLIDLYLILAACLIDSSHSRTMDILNQCSDDLFKMAFNRVNNECYVINYLLCKVGLLKSEESKTNNQENDNSYNLRGVLLSLQHCVNEKYFPKSCSLILKKILDNPPVGADMLKTYHNDKAQLAGVLYRIVQ